MADAKTDEIRNFVVGPIQTNCYAYVSGGACMVVDPGAAGAAVAEHLADVRVECVVATHGHGDHVGGAAALVAATGAPFCINAADAERAMHAGEPSELGIAYDDDAPAPDRELSEGDVISVGTATFTVVETPGHTPGGIVLLGLVAPFLIEGYPVFIAKRVETSTTSMVVSVIGEAGVLVGGFMLRLLVILAALPVLFL